MPFPPGTKEANFDYEAVLNENVRMHFYILSCFCLVITMVSDVTPRLIVTAELTRKPISDDDQFRDAPAEGDQTRRG